MARIKPSKEPKEKAVAPKPTPKQTVETKQQPNIIPKGTATPVIKATTQPKRRTLQDRRPALKELQKPVERKIVTKPVYDKKGGITTKRTSETKEVVIKPVSAPSKSQKTLTPKPLPHGRSVGDLAIAKARQQQEQAIDEARTAYTTKQQEAAEDLQAFNQKEREQGEAGYRLSLDSQGRYQRNR